MYCVTAQRASCVYHSLTGNFTAPDACNLIISKVSTIEIYSVSPEGLQPVDQLSLYARIACMRLFRPQDSDQDFLFILSERNEFSVIRYNPGTSRIETLVHGDAQDRIGRPCESGTNGFIDPHCRMIGLHLFDGILKVAPISPNGDLIEMFNVRLDEFDILDMVLLHSWGGEIPENPLLVMLHSNLKHSRDVKVFEISLESQEISSPLFVQSNLDSGANMVIPVDNKRGGFLVVGEFTISYFTGPSDPVECIDLPRPMIATAFGMIDSNRYLVGDHRGYLYVVAISSEGRNDGIISVEELGTTSIASSISYLDNGFVYIGSSFGDSQLIQLKEETCEDGSFVQVCDKYANLGPIQDFCLVDSGRQEIGHIVTCSGGYKDGSLRAVRIGVGIGEHAELDVPGIKGMWSLTSSSDSTFHKYIVFSFVNESKLLGMTDEGDLEEVDLPGFSLDTNTCFCCNVVHDCALQVTNAEVRLVSLHSGALLGSWNAHEEVSITAASANQTHILLVVGGRSLTLLTVDNDCLVELCSRSFDFDISCIDIGKNLPSQNPCLSNWAAISFWDDISLSILSLKDLMTVSTIPIEGDFVARSVMISTLHGQDYVFCGLADGHLSVFFVQNDGSLSVWKQVSVGSQPIQLTRFTVRDEDIVFASSDRPTVISGNHGNLMFSNVNMKDITHVTGFHTENTPDCLALSTDTRLVIGSIDDVRKLHIRSVYLGEHPRRIAHHASARCFLVGTTRHEILSDGREYEVSLLKLIDDQHFEILDEVTLDQFESISALQYLSISEKEYFCFGTAYVRDDESEPSVGRLGLYEVVDGKLLFVTSYDVSGAVYSIAPFDNKILCSVNSRIEIFVLIDNGDAGKELECDCGILGHVVSLQVIPFGSFILAIDLMKSASLYCYTPPSSDSESGSLKEIARDNSPTWPTCASIIDDNSYVVAESNFNLYRLRRNVESANPMENHRLDVSGEYHLGDLVNKFVPGLLVQRSAIVEDVKFKNPTLYATVSGAIGLLVEITDEDFQLLSQVEKTLKESFIGGIGGFSHDRWRSFLREKSCSGAFGFVDGDLLEQILEFPRDEIERVATQSGVDASRLLKVVETLSHLH